MFGDISNGEIHTNEIGDIVRREWLKSAELRPNVRLHNFVVMPNHFHGMFEITQKIGADDCTVFRPYVREIDVEKNEYMSSISPKCGELGTIVRAFKSAVTKSIHAAGYEFAWQRNLWEHVVRDYNDYARIDDYIANNPAKWNDDTFYQK